MQDEWGILVLDKSLNHTVLRTDHRETPVFGLAVISFKDEFVQLSSSQLGTRGNSQTCGTCSKQKITPDLKS